MKINVLHFTKGAAQARGLTVIIDVFYDFSVEAYLMRAGAKTVIPVGDINTAMNFKKNHPDAILCGERGGIKIEGFDYGNSPTEIEKGDFLGKTVIHATSAGTQGVKVATEADEIVGGNLVCAKAIEEYVRRKNPEEVSLVCMGEAGETPADEDILAAEYIKSLIENKSIPNINKKIEELKKTSGARFFDEAQKDVFPTSYFELCTKVNSFPFVLCLRDGGPDGFRYMERVDIFDTPKEAPTGPVTVVKEGARMSDFTGAEAELFPERVKGRVAYGNYKAPEGCFDAALVLGCPDLFMKSRAEAAARLYLGGQCRMFITTGGVFRDTQYGFVTEAEALKHYMTDMGVPKELIITETNATTTRENMTCSRQIVAEGCAKEYPRLAIVTSYFHTRRAVELAKAYIKDAEVLGVRGDFPNYDPENFSQDPLLAEAVTKECKCLCNYVRRKLIPDFEVH